MKRNKRKAQLRAAMQDQKMQTAVEFLHGDANGQVKRSRAELLSMAATLNTQPRTTVFAVSDIAKKITVRRTLRDIYGVVESDDAMLRLGIVRTDLVETRVSKPLATIVGKAAIQSIWHGHCLEVELKSGKIIEQKQIGPWGGKNYGRVGKVVEQARDATSGVTTWLNVRYEFGGALKRDGSDIVCRRIVTVIARTKPFLEIDAPAPLPITNGVAYASSATPLPVLSKQASFAALGIDSRALVFNVMRHDLFTKTAGFSDDQVKYAGNFAGNASDTKVDVDNATLIIISPYCRSDIRDDAYVQRLALAGSNSSVLLDYLRAKLDQFCAVTGAPPESVQMQVGYKGPALDKKHVTAHREPSGASAGRQRVEGWTSLARPNSGDGLLGIVPGLDQSGGIDREDSRIRMIGHGQLVIYRGMRRNQDGYLDMQTPNALLHVDNNLLNKNRRPAGGLRIRFQSDQAPALV